MLILLNALSAKSGGIATYTRNLIESFQNRGVSCDVYTALSALPSEDPGSSVSVKGLSVDKLNAILRLIWEQTVWRRLVNRSRPDILFSSANYGVLFARSRQLLLLREGGLINPVYQRYILPKLGARYRIEAFFRRIWMFSTARHAERVMVPTETMGSWVKHSAPHIKDRIVVNLYGSKASMFGASKRRCWREDGILRTLFVSVYYPHKSPETLVRAVRLLTDHGFKAHARITMEQSQFIQWKIGEAEWQILLNDNLRDVATYGAIEYTDLPETYANHDVMVFPSVSETFGHSLVEAMAAGCPIIAADTLTNREICGSAALYFPIYDYETLASRLRQLDERPDLRDWLSEQGKARMKDKFQWEDHVQRLVDICSSLSDAA